MNDLNLSAVINQCEFDFDKVSSIHYESEQNRMIRRLSRSPTPS